MNIKYQFINNESDFLDIKEKWEEIFSKSTNHIFSSFNWNYYWWKNYKGSAKLLIIILYQDKQPISIFPLYYLKELCFTKYSLLSSNFVASDYLDIICIKNLEKECLEFYQYLFATTFSKCSYFHLKDFTNNSLLYNLVTSYKNQRMIAYSGSTNKFCPYLQLPDQIDSIFNHHSEKTKSRFLSYVRSAFNNPDVRFQIGFMDNPTTSLDYFTELHLKRISSQGKFSNFSNQRFVHFHKDYIQNSPDSVLFFWIIKHDTPIASAYCLILNDAVYFYNSGFNPDASVKKIGQILLYKMFDYLISKNIKTFYFLRGSEKYKYFWTSFQNELYYAEIFQSNLSRLFNSIKLRIHGK